MRSSTRSKIRSSTRSSIRSSSKSNLVQHKVVTSSTSLLSWSSCYHHHQNLVFILPSLWSSCNHHLFFVIPSSHTHLSHLPILHVVSSLSHLPIVEIVSLEFSPDFENRPSHWRSPQLTCIDEFDVVGYSTGLALKTDRVIGGPHNSLVEMNHSLQQQKMDLF